MEQPHRQMFTYGTVDKLYSSSIENTARVPSPQCPMNSAHQNGGHTWPLECCFSSVDGHSLFDQNRRVLRLLGRRGGDNEV
jgi:hypothetical protein